MPNAVNVMARFDGGGSIPSRNQTFVMPGLDPGIHALPPPPLADGRVKPGHDVVFSAADGIGV